MSARTALLWEVCEEHENEAFILVLKNHTDPASDIKPWRITCSRKGGDTEHEDFDREADARSTYQHYLEACGMTELQVQPPENPEELWASYIMRAKQVKADGEALRRLEEEFEADPKVHEWIRELLAIAHGPGQKSWAALSFRRGLEEIQSHVLKQEQLAKQTAMGKLQQIPNFGRF